MNLLKNKRAMSSEVFKLLLAVIVIASLLSIFAVFFMDVRVAGAESINSTAGALEEFSIKIANRTAGF